MGPLSTPRPLKRIPGLPYGNVTEERFVLTIVALRPRALQRRGQPSAAGALSGGGWVGLDWGARPVMVVGNQALFIRN